MHGRVEATARLGARLEREPDDADEVGSRFQHARRVQSRELGVRAEAREERLEPVELVLRGLERAFAGGSVEEQFDLGPHRGEAVLDHDDLVAVTGASGASLTTGERTAAAAAAAACAFCRVTSAIASRRSARRAR